jgi:restriction endonuclease
MVKYCDHVKEKLNSIIKEMGKRLNLLLKTLIKILLEIENYHLKLL